MRTPSLPASFFTENRQKLKPNIPENHICFLDANPVFPSNADAYYPYIKNNDLYYLTGIAQEDTLLVLYPDHPDPKYREILFIKETNALIKVWEGEKHSKPEATNISNIETVFWSTQFEQVLEQIAPRAAGFCFNLYENARGVPNRFSKNHALFLKVTKQYPLHGLARIQQPLHALRQVKQTVEIEQLQEAIDLTETGFTTLLPLIKEGKKEYELEAFLSQHFLAAGANGFAYSPIIASGKNACILHYIQNNATLKKGELVLMDIGAQLGHYNADITRCVPVNGQYSSRQKQVYNAVLDIQEEIITMLEPGLSLKEINSAANDKTTAALLSLGLLDKTDVKNNPEAFKKFYMHSIGHHLGLDVHDVGNTEHALQPGMVLTIEPGIYIDQESLGIRIENNIVITETGHKDLSSTIPKTIDEIETLMNEPNA